MTVNLLAKAEAYYLFAKHKLGLMPQDELIRHIRPLNDFDELHPLDKHLLSDLFDKFRRIRNYQEFEKVKSAMREIGPVVQTLYDKYKDTKPKVADTLGKLIKLDDASTINAAFRPAGTYNMGHLSNPFKPFLFYGQNHPIYASILQVLFKEVLHDGFYAEPVGKVSQKTIKEEETLLMQHQIRDKRWLALLMTATYNNCVTLLKSDSTVEILPMDRLWPIYSRATREIIGWDYTVTPTSSIVFPTSQTAHFYIPGIDCDALGTPLATSVVVDLDADIGASMHNRNMIYTGGTLGTIVSLEHADGNEKATATAFAKMIQDDLRSNYSGVDSPLGIWASNFVKGVHRIMSPKDFDGSFEKFRPSVARTLCSVLGVSPNKINLNRNDDQIYSAARLEDSSSSQFDKTLTANMMLIDEHFNTEILPHIGVNNLRIKTTGRWGSYSKDTAQAGLYASQTGPVTTVNEQRVYYFGLPPLPLSDKRGRRIIDNSKMGLDGTKEPEYAAVDTLDMELTARNNR